jgi:CBS domain-containing protein
MLVSEVMSRNIEIIDPEYTLRQTAEKMRKLDVGYLPVGENDRLIGMITDRDITIRGTAKGMNPDKAKARDVMTKKVVYCFEDQTVEEAAKMMEDKEVRRLTVLNRDKRAVGVCSLGDIANATGDQRLCRELLESVSAHHL